jgi:uncharacterized protein (UPF0210 family)
MCIRFFRAAILLAALLASFGTDFLPAQQKTPSPSATRPKIRAITAFINLDPTQYKSQIADTLQMLRRAKTTFESRGYEVQTIRIATQPFPEYTKGFTTLHAVAFFKELDALSEKEKFAPGIGPAMLRADDPESQADLLAEIIANTKHIRGSIVIAGDDGIRWRAIGAAARAIKKLEDSTEKSQGNFNLGAIADVKPLSPFFTAAYHTGFGHQFAVGLESANVVAEAFRGSTNINDARKKLTDMLTAEVMEIERQALRIDRETGWAYVGMDLSPAPMKDVSIGAAIENLIDQPFGSAGTLTAAGAITAAIRDIPAKQTGYNGLMLPILEDSRLAQRWSEGRVSLSGLLSYSAVCGTGLDTVPLPGDITVEQLDMILADVATLAVKWKKPLTARLMPVKGKGPGQMTEFDDPNLVNAVIQPLGFEGAGNP